MVHWKGSAVSGSSRSSSEAALTLDELCAEAGVTVRTVRYYISEGLLPPPDGHGTAARYSAEHRDRLAVIGRLKEQYLPLREIRRALDAMSPEQVADTARLVTTDIAQAVSEQPIQAARSVQSPPNVTARMMAPPPAAPSSQSARNYISEALTGTPRRRAGAPQHPPPAREVAWRRVAISDEAELLVTESAWQRREEQLESLISWARKILKGA